MNKLLLIINYALSFKFLVLNALTKILKKYKE